MFAFILVAGLLLFTGAPLTLLYLFRRPGPSSADLFGPGVFAAVVMLAGVILGGLGIGHFAGQQPGNEPRCLATIEKPYDNQGDTNQLCVKWWTPDPKAHK